MFPETIHAGIEDAWVLSRMLENYEEETNEALSSYTKYRRPRINRFAKYTEQETFKLLNSHGPQRFTEYLDWRFQLDSSRKFLCRAKTGYMVMTASGASDKHYCKSLLSALKLFRKKFIWSPRILPLLVKTRYSG